MKYNILIFSFLILIMSSTCITAAWWNDTYEYRQNITLTGNTSGAQTDYQLLLNVTYDSDMQSDFDDLRFCNETHELGAWLESKVDSSYALVWVEFPTTPANGVTQDYWMYYGNAGAASDWDGAASFPFFDGFDSETDNTIPDNWTVDETYGTVRIDSSVYYGDSGKSVKVIDSSGAGWPTMVHDLVTQYTKLRFLAKIRPAQTNQRSHHGLQNSFDTYAVFFLWEQNGYFKYTDGATWTNIQAYNADTWYRLEVLADVATDKSDIYVDGALQINDGNFDNGVSEISKISFLGHSTAQATYYIDDVAACAYVTGPPTYAFGSEEYYILLTPTTLINETKLIMSEITQGMKGINMGNYLVYTFILIGILLIILGIQIITNNIYRR